MHKAADCEPAIASAGVRRLSAPVPLPSGSKPDLLAPSLAKLMYNTVQTRKLYLPTDPKFTLPTDPKASLSRIRTLHHRSLKLPLSFLSRSLLVGSQHLLSRWSTQAALIPGIDSLSTRYQIAVSDREQP
jgi:hypothetical protein